jgi:hypothetical protein
MIVIEQGWSRYAVNEWKDAQMMGNYSEPRSGQYSGCECLKTFATAAKVVVDGYRVG